MINCSGNNTALGASSALPTVIDAVSAIMAEFVEMPDLHRKASKTIARTMNCEAGTVCNSVAAGISVSVAATITGTDLAAIERIPDTGDRSNEVIIQAGHDVHYGQPIEQAVAIGGGRLVRVGVPTRTMPFQLEAAITDATTAAVFVVSHHVVQHGNLPFGEFVEICHRRGVPVIVDLADVQDFEKYHALGADLTLHSAHKFLRSHTAGLIAGRKDLVRAAYLQNFGVGRCMKVGKESVAAAIAALEAWRNGVQLRGYEHNATYLDYWVQRLSGLPGLEIELVDMPVNTSRKLLRLRVKAEEANMLARDLSQALSRHDPPIYVADHRVEEGWFLLNPYQLHPGEEALVADAICAIMSGAQKEPKRDFTTSENAYSAGNFTSFSKQTLWPD